MKNVLLILMVALGLSLVGSAYAGFNNILGVDSTTIWSSQIIGNSTTVSATAADGSQLAIPMGNVESACLDVLAMGVTGNVTIEAVYKLNSARAANGSAYVTATVGSTLVILGTPTPYSSIIPISFPSGVESMSFRMLSSATGSATVTAVCATQ